MKNQVLVESILYDKKYLLRYHLHRDLLHPLALDITLDVEAALKKIPPIRVTKEEIISYENTLHQLIRKIAGYSFYVGIETIRTGFPNDDFFSVYHAEERKELAHYIFDQQEVTFTSIIKAILRKVSKTYSTYLKKYYEDYLKDAFISRFTQFFKEIFLLSFQSSGKGKPIPLYTV